jgi:hypothetical protein
MNTAANTQPAPEPGENQQPNPQPDLSVVPKGKRRSPSALDRAQSALVRKVILICLAAQKWAQALAAQGVTAKFVSTLLAEAKAIFDMDDETLDADSDSKAATRGGAAAKKKLVTSLRGLQSAGRQLHENTTPEKLTDYLIGEDIKSSRAILERSANALINKVSEERPPGVNTEVITRVEGELTDVTGQQQTQQDEKLEAKALRTQRDNKVESIARRAREIQLAADRAFPHADPENASPRTKFFLPTRRSFAPKPRKA